MNKTYLKWLLLFVLVAAAGAFFIFDLQQFFNFAYLQARHLEFRDYYAQHTLLTALVYFGVYVLVTALSLPGALVMTIAGGAIFGVIYGTIIVSFASTIGATLAFLAARFILRDFVQNKFTTKLQTINAEMKNNGVFYLFTLRLVPIFPFFMINMVMGLTTIKTWHFFCVSQVAMLLGTLLYVNAGAQLSELQTPADILSWQLLLSFAVLGIFPLLAKKIVSMIKARHVYRGFTRPRHYDYNLVVIGAGAGGLVSAYIGATVKAKTLLIEKHKMGGDCLNSGCVPSKALLKSAQIAALPHQAKKYGFDKIELSYRFSEVMERVQRVIAEVEPHDSVARYRGLGVECEQGEAKIISPYTVQVQGCEHLGENSTLAAKERTVTARNIIIASGATPLVPKLPGLEQVTYYTAETIWQLRERPARMLVLGGGPIGCELAQAFARLGVQVVQLEMGARLLPREDVEVSDFMLRTLRDDGIEVLTEHQALSFGQEGGESFVLCQAKGQARVEEQAHGEELARDEHYPQGELGRRRITFDVALLALGRKATVTGFCGEAMQLELSERGTLQVNEYLQTSYPNIYACGDVVGPYQFTHLAAHQAWYCAVNALFAPVSFKVDYRVVPWCTFTDPEVAHVGLSASEAERLGIAYEVTTYGIDDLDRAITDSEARGFVKVLTVPQRDKVLGATIVGARAGELITEFVSAMKHGIGLNKILGTIHIYPTFAEANKYLAGNWKKAHAPTRALAYLERWHSWRRG